MPVSNVAFPLGAPAVNGTQVTVDTMLNQPTRITRRIADLTLQRFIVTRIFAQGGTVEGGAVIYDQATLNELYLDRDVERRMPGEEYPLVSGSRQAPKVAEVEDWGGKFFITDEARRRNSVALFNNQTTQLANTIVRKVNQRAVDTIESAISSFGGALTFTGTNWNAVVTAGTSATNNSGMPAADFAKAQLLADVDELGVNYDMWIVNPAQKYQFSLVYGDKAAAVLDAQGVREMYASNRVAAGTGYVLASNQVGEIRLEQGLATETWREAKTKRNWVQSSIVPTMYVTNPYSIRKVVGLAG